VTDAFALAPKTKVGLARKKSLLAMLPPYFLNKHKIEPKTSKGKTLVASSRSGQGLKNE
jgi:hypothetical protein